MTPQNLNGERKLLSPRLLLAYTGTEFEDKMYQVNWIYLNQYLLNIM